jgi:alginate O-acetyltransferase complex protein AlgI
MLFNSLSFIVFTAIFFAFWGLAKQRQNTRWLYIVVASFIFYGWWDWRYLTILVITGLINFYAAIQIVRHPQRRRFFLVLSLISNLGILGIFKYSLFLLTNIEGLVQFLGFGLHISTIPPFLLVVPLGISFYTFQAISYTVDVYTGRVQPTEKILHFFSYLSLFPHLTAGPILRADPILKDLERDPPISEEKRWLGTKYIIIGYFMKVVLADNLITIVDPAFKALAPQSNPVYWWVVMVSFALQIYLDFAGYSNIAVGLAHWMGYQFPKNFDHPYGVNSLQEFWRRWHITLTSWLRDYVFFPFSRMLLRCSKGRNGQGILVASNLLTMLVSGLWHGPAWTFVIWGVIHGSLLSFERMTRWPNRLLRIGTLGAGMAILIVHLQILLGWVFFRSQSIEQAFMVMGRLVDVNQLIQLRFSGLTVASVWWIIVAILFELAYRNSETIKNRVPLLDKQYVQVCLLALLLMVCVLFRGPGAVFVYFQF